MIKQFKELQEQFKKLIEDGQSLLDDMLRKIDSEVIAVELSRGEIKGLIKLLDELADSRFRDDFRAMCYNGTSIRSNDIKDIKKKLDKAYNQTRLEN